MVDRAGLAAVPKPIGVDPEMAALRRFLPEVVTWEGPLHVRGIARGTAKVIQDGRWIAGDDEQDQPLADGTFVLTWQFHWVSGWAPQHGEYRATMADSNGNAEV